MRMGQYLSAAIFIVVTLVSQRAYCTDIYRWVDDEGIVHFSDTRPNDDADVRMLRVNVSNPPGYGPAQDRYSIVNQAKRMNNKWSELADERERRAEKRRESAPQFVQYQPQRYDGWRYSYWPGYYRQAYPDRRPLRQVPTIRRQLNSLDALQLSGPRPHSINSGAHHARVERSNNFLSSMTRPAPHRN
ncbi:MAG: DUF4124 domain-containing protein [Gammaproteobacteria bacterium]|nr:DUF4124 domain-containing protein [Gammaproteobacteria bacterium]